MFELDAQNPNLFFYLLLIEASSSFRIIFLIFYLANDNKRMVFKIFRQYCVTWVTALVQSLLYLLECQSYWCPKEITGSLMLHNLTIHRLNSFFTFLVFVNMYVFMGDCSWVNTWGCVVVYVWGSEDNFGCLCSTLYQARWPKGFQRFPMWLRGAGITDTCTQLNVGIGNLGSSPHHWEWCALANEPSP